MLSQVMAALCLNAHGGNEVQSMPDKAAVLRRSTSDN